MSSLFKTLSISDNTLAGASVLKPYLISLIAICFIVFTTQARGGSEPAIRIATIPQESTHINIATDIITQLYQRLGQTLELVPLKANESLALSNQGELDGELIRVKAIEKKYPNLVRIPYGINSLKTMAFTRINGPKVVGMGGLLGKKVGYLRGIELYKSITKNLENEEFYSIKSMFQGLIHGGVDVVLFPLLDGQIYLREQKLNDQVRMQKNAIIEVKLYHYLHKSHNRLINDLNKLLKKMEASGELNHLVSEMEQKAGSFERNDRSEKN